MPTILAMIGLAAALSTATAPVVPPPAPATAIDTDPAIDTAYPASLAAFVLSSGDGAMNAVMYVAAGTGPHPTLLLLHGFPGNEQNLDLAQAARRAGWNVLTLHYRGSWGSPGTFSFTHAAEDAHRALAFLREPATIAKFAIDPTRIVVAGHSLGGFLAADAAADDKAVAALFLIDPFDISAVAEMVKTPADEAGWKAEVAGDLPPLAGTSYDALTGEVVATPRRFDLGARITAYGNRPIVMVGAFRGLGGVVRRLEPVAHAASPGEQASVLSTDHSFSDQRIALTTLLLTLLGRIAPPALAH